MAKLLLGGNNLSAIEVARYNSNGTLDTSFNAEGKFGAQPGTVITSFGNFSPFGLGLVIQPDSKIVIAGYLNGLFATEIQYVIVRYNPDGTLDTSFNAHKTPGFLIDSFGNSYPTNQVNDMILLKNGKIFVVGWVSSGINSLAIASYNSDGSVDTTFNPKGIGARVGAVIGNFGMAGSDTKAEAVLEQGDGKIVVGGQGSNLFDQNNQFFVTRYYANGTLDQSFGQQGLVLTNLGGLDDTILSLAFDSQENIVAGGITGSRGDYGFGLTRYLD